MSDAAGDVGMSFEACLLLQFRRRSLLAHRKRYSDRLGRTHAGLHASSRRR
ncbi:MAG: hypothetical protein M5R36_05960 [Deltaproteobacteria bacterium]|nr:hypothetical protein [Deltaproteobacteria bacterium]